MKGQQHETDTCHRRPASLPLHRFATRQDDTGKDEQR